MSSERGNVESFLTKSDLLKNLEQFKADLLKEVKLIAVKSNEPFEKKWLKSVEVRKLLDLSHGKLQTMRNSGTLRFTKIGGTIYYDKEDILTMFEKNKVKK